MKKQLAFYVNAKKCIGCISCAMACKNQYKQEVGEVWRKVHPVDEKFYPHRERAFLSLACNHCEKPICVEVCPTKAITKRAKDGIVILDQNKCVNDGSCREACPYGVPVLNPKKNVSSKCHLCHERVDSGLKPACVQGCPTGALQLIDLSRFNETGAIQYPDGFPKETDLNPSTRFKLASKPVTHMVKSDK